MRAHLRNALRRPSGAGRALPLAVLLTVVVIAAAGVSGTAEFTGARWYPNIQIGTSTTRTNPFAVRPRSRNKPRVRVHKAYTSWLLYVGIALVLVVLASFIVRWIRGLRLAPPAPGEGLSTAVAPQAKPQEPEPEPEPAKLMTGIERALDTLNEEHEPGDAVIRAWLGLQETAEQSGIVRRASETPTEFASRVLARAVADPEPLRTLLQLYLRARFGDHPVTPGDVSAVRAALQQLLGSWVPADVPAGAAVRSQ